LTVAGRSSRRKGKRGEYIVRDLLRKWGFEARRGVAHAGEPDLVWELHGYHFEVKNQEALNIWAALKQAEEDAVTMFEKRWRTVSESLRPRGDTPVVFFKRNGTKMYAAIDAEELLRLLCLESTYEEFKEINDAQP
jgi:hypothetical protein